MEIALFVVCMFASAEAAYIVVLLNCINKNESSKKEFCKCKKEFCKCKQILRDDSGICRICGLETRN